MKSTKYDIRILCPAPSMCQDTTTIEAESYTVAVSMAHDAWRKTGRSVVLCSHGHYYYWHRIASDGVATDRNTNGGLPTVQQLVRGAA